MSDITTKWAVPFLEGTDPGNQIDDVDWAKAELLDDLLTPYDRPLSTVRSVALHLGVTPRTVQTLLANGALASYKIEGSRRIAPADVDAYLARCRKDRTVR